MKIEDLHHIINQIKDESTRRAVAQLMEKVIEELDKKADD